MFDSEFAAVGDAELIAAIEDGARAEAAASARRLAAIAELVRRRVDDDERALWAFDPWDGVAAEVAAALNVGHRRASGRCASRWRCATGYPGWPRCISKAS